MKVFSIIATISALFFGTAVKADQRIVFLGDSLTAGYELDPELAYPKLIEERLLADGYEVTVVNAGVSGDTSAGGLRRLEWVLKTPADYLIIALGANDALRGQDPKATAENLTQTIRQARKLNNNIEIILAGMLAPPNMGTAYQYEFQKIYPNIAKEEGVTLIPFLLDGVAGIPKFNSADGVHPNPKGQEIIADLVLNTLKPLLNSEHRR